METPRTFAWKATPLSIILTVILTVIIYIILTVTILTTVISLNHWSGGRVLGQSPSRWADSRCNDSTAILSYPLPCYYRRPQVSMWYGVWSGTLPVQEAPRHHRQASQLHTERSSQGNFRPRQLPQQTLQGIPLPR